MKRQQMILKAIYLVTTIVGIYFMAQVLMPKTGFVEVSVLFNNFELTTELENEFNKVKDARTKELKQYENRIDSLRYHLEKENNQESKLLDEFSFIARKYQQKKQEYTELNLILEEKYNNQIMLQLNQYVKEFGEKNSYDIIHGANGNGSLMYAKDILNLTEEVKAFINNKYKGI